MPSGITVSTFFIWNYNSPHFSVIGYSQQIKCKNCVWNRNTFTYGLCSFAFINGKSWCCGSGRTASAGEARESTWCCKKYQRGKKKQTARTQHGPEHRGIEQRASSTSGVVARIWLLDKRACLIYWTTTNCMVHSLISNVSLPFPVSPELTLHSFALLL